MGTIRNDHVLELQAQAVGHLRQRLLVLLRALEARPAVVLGEALPHCLRHEPEGPVGVAPLGPPRGRHQQRTARLKHAFRLLQGLRDGAPQRLGQVVQHLAQHHDVEGAVCIRQPQHVTHFEAGVARGAFRHRRGHHLRAGVEAHHLRGRKLRGELTAEVARAATSVQEPEAAPKPIALLEHAGDGVSSVRSAHLRVARCLCIAISRRRASRWRGLVGHTAVLDAPAGASGGRGNPKRPQAAATGARKMRAPDGTGQPHGLHRCGAGSFARGPAASTTKLEPKA
mmetsp:Transcript_49824/g.138417  ORF Transcript_49824/g.138417 Transcript_49824/m.138417 type:complete len:284 (-) Transcript_49824:4-855(-)